MLRLLFTFYFLLFTFFANPVYAVCNAKLGPCEAGLDQIEQLFTNVISVMVGLGFVALLVMLILAGFKYLTSGGEQKALQSAHQTVTWALLGVLFLAIAWLILQLIQAFTGIDVTVFKLKTLCDAVGDPGKWCRP